LSAALDGLDAAFDRVLEFDCQALTTREQLALLERFERLRRRIPGAEHPLINAVARQATPEELGGKLSHAIAEATLISRAEAARRIKEAADLGPRHGLSGEPLPPVLAASATAQRDGRLGTGQVSVIRRFYHQLPGWVDATTREEVETELATQGAHSAAPIGLVRGSRYGRRHSCGSTARTRRLLRISMPSESPPLATLGGVVSSASRRRNAAVSLWLMSSSRF
jgi:Domain of unknown function (DUF222)